MRKHHQREEFIRLLNLGTSLPDHQAKLPMTKGEPFLFNDDMDVDSKFIVKHNLWRIYDLVIFMQHTIYIYRKWIFYTHFFRRGGNGEPRDRLQSPATWGTFAFTTTTTTTFISTREGKTNLNGLVCQGEDWKRELCYFPLSYPLICEVPTGVQSLLHPLFMILISVLDRITSLWI